MKELNKDIITRDKIIFGKYKASPYQFDDGTRKYDGLTADDIQELINQNFADPESAATYYAPTTQQILDFITKYPSYTAHGIVTCEDREDYGVYIHGVEKGSPAESAEELRDYMLLFATFDEFNDMTMYCWFG